MAYLSFTKDKDHTTSNYIEEPHSKCSFWLWNGIVHMCTVFSRAEIYRYFGIWNPEMTSIALVKHQQTCTAFMKATWCTLRDPLVCPSINRLLSSAQQFILERFPLLILIRQESAVLPRLTWFKKRTTYCAHN